MKISEIKNELLSTLSPYVVNEGFKANKTHFCLKKDDATNECQFSFDYNSWGDEIHVFPYVQIKNKRIHTICEAHGFHLNYTAFVNLLLLKRICEGKYTEDLRWQMQYDRQDKFVICDNGDFERAKSEMIKLLPVGLKYLCANSDIRAIDKMYNTPPLNRQNPNCSGADTRCIVGLIAAKLAHDGDYEQICSHYSDVMMTADVLQDTRLKFEGIKGYLASL